jgi:peptidoglycan/xylan/chitin deacetylase (PgdA/CDA1 family)
MIRNLKSVGTFPLFEQNNFGSGIPRNFAVQQIALCFDLYDDSSGLSVVLDALNRYGVRATFFVNGEFIRRHPQAAKELAESGHEVASMFFAPMDLSDSRYRVDKTFIERGLARNEDEYYKTTGRELALLWHPPYYAFSEEIAVAAAGIGYRTMDRDVDCGDWIRSDDAKRLSGCFPCH